MDVMKNTTSNPSNCDGQIAPKKKRDEKICQEILHNKKSNWDGRTDMPQKNRRNIIQLGWTNGYAPKKRETSSNWDGQICQEILHEKETSN